MILRTETSAALKAIDPENRLPRVVRSLLVDALNAEVHSRESAPHRTDAKKARTLAAEEAATLVAALLDLGDPESELSRRVAARAARIDLEARLEAATRRFAAVNLGGFEPWEISDAREEYDAARDALAAAK